MNDMNERDQEPLRNRPDRDRDDALAHLLRATDPAAGAKLDPVVRAELRRTVLDAAAQRRSSSTWRALAAPWATAVAATAVLVAGAGLAFLLLGEKPIDTSAPSAVPPTGSEPVETVSIPEEAAAEPPVSAPTADAGTPATAATTVAETASPSGSAPPDRPSRTLHLTASRGTRIIWTLDPSFKSPIDGYMPRQENAP